MVVSSIILPMTQGLKETENKILNQRRNTKLTVTPMDSTRLSNDTKKTKHKNIKFRRGFLQERCLKIYKPKRRFESRFCSITRVYLDKTP
jgi:hypothetical protein